ncbi:MAG TPA: SDR family NAD(P)-dependent oxidoreductase [Solirubrobacteraceae bacterium]|nr:SDR family NAD(P)-dependent oxidoreductase [Solirubrobacteraceae bacterium]
MRNVLITGGTGYLGRALARRLLHFTDVERICVLSRGEYAQAMMRSEFESTLAILNPAARMRWFIGDVRDLDRMCRAMQGVDTVIHTAALKRVEVGEYNPTEMVHTNVHGAINVVRAAELAGVKRVVGISSDKACEPVNCYGATKLTMEKLFLAASTDEGEGGPSFSVCRYGNVAGSTGSVIPTWRAIIKSGGTARMTDPECTRFWMRLDQAVDLVMWTTRQMRGGETVVPILPVYRLGDLAEAMGVRFTATGMGAGEKHDETMIAPHESADFRLLEPYLVRGGWGVYGCRPVGIQKVTPRRMSVEDLRTALREVA